MAVSVPISGAHCIKCHRQEAYFCDAVLVLYKKVCVGTRRLFYYKHLEIRGNLNVDVLRGKQNP